MKFMTFFFSQLDSVMIGLNFDIVFIMVISVMKVLIILQLNLFHRNKFIVWKSVVQDVFLAVKFMHTL